MGSRASSRKRRTKPRRRQAPLEVACVSYAFLTVGIESALAHVESQSGTIHQREEAFVAGFFEPGSDFCAHSGIAIGSRHGNLLRVGVDECGVQMDSRHGSDRASIVE